MKSDFMKIVIAPDSFKGSLSSLEVADAIQGGIVEAMPDSDVVKVPMADGGEGTVEAIVTTAGGRYIEVVAKSPLFEDIRATFGILNDGQTAIIEMAAASGFPLVSEEKRNPLITTTYGTGQLVVEALKRGCKKIIIGIGGSATVDGGAGMAQAIGVKLSDRSGQNIGLGGGCLGDLEKIDLSQRVNLNGIEVIVASDVTNPLLGNRGAARTYGPQKGATPEMVKVLERNLAHFAEVIKKYLGIDVVSIPGSGAAGGLGAGIVAFLDGKIESGVDTIIRTVKLEEKIKGSDMVITGEGKIDYQTVYGKAPVGVAKIAKKFGVPVLAVCGTRGDGYEKLKRYGVVDILSIIDIAKNETEARERSSEFLRKLVRSYFQDKKI